MKHIIIVLSLLLSFSASAAIENYQVTQEEIKTVVAPMSRLLRANCIFLDVNGKQIAHQNVTVTEQEGGILLVELNTNYEKHAKIVEVVCR